MSPAGVNPPVVMSQALLASTSTPMLPPFCPVLSKRSFACLFLRNDFAYDPIGVGFLGIFEGRLKSTFEPFDCLKAAFNCSKPKHRNNCLA